MIRSEEKPMLGGDAVRAGRPSLLLPQINTAASATLVNRTHRVVRERAKMLETRRNRVRSLWIPMAICSALLVILCSAVWSVLDQYELTPTGVPDASNQLLVLLLWFLPVSATVLGMVWFRRTREQAEDEVAKS